MILKIRKVWFLPLIRNYITWGVVKESGDKLELNDDYHYILEWILIELIGHLKKEPGKSNQL